MVGPDGTKKPLSRSSFEKRERESMSKEVYRQLTRTRLPSESDIKCWLMRLFIC
jgi:hypothetical protein